LKENDNTDIIGYYFSGGNFMKKWMVLVFIFVLGLNVSSAQEDNRNLESGINIYTLFVNIVNEQFRFPLIGFVNLARGSHNSPQIGFVNWNQKDLNGLQMSFVNTNGGSFQGAQISFINTNIQSLTGLQMGFINTTAGERMKGVQLGFINTSVDSTKGAQIAFINITKQLQGFQFGFINYIEELEGGFPLGFISFVKNGGYKAVEYSVSEISPINISLKLGIEKLYTSIYFGYNPLKDDIHSAINTGLGFGSIMRFTESFFFNPELIVNSNFGKGAFLHLSLIPYFGYKLLPHLTVVTGPSVTWEYGKEFDDPFFRILEKEINERNRIYIGARLGIRYEW
jgi:hypothetical protein